MCHGNSVSDADTSFIEEEFSAVEVNSGKMFASTFRPTGAVRGKVLVLSDIFGRSPFYRMIGRRLAAEGFLAFVPEMFSRLWPVADGDETAGLQRVRQLDQRITLSEMEGCIKMLRESGSDTGVGVLGFCLGGTLAMLLAARNSVDAAGIYYGITERRPTTEFAPFVVLDEIAKARVPLLGFWGDRDERVSMESVREADQRLEEAGAPHQFTILPGLPHAFLTFDPEAPTLAQSAESWSQMLEFYFLNLKRN